MRQGAHETATSFISHWREKVIQMIDRPSEREHISMIMRSLQPSYARHLMGVPIMDYRALIEAFYGIKDGMARGLWSDSSSSDSKGKKSSRSYKPGEVGAISSFRHGAPRPQYGTRLLMPGVQFSIDLPYHLSRLGYRLHILYHTQFMLHRLWRDLLLLILNPERPQFLHSSLDSSDTLRH